MLPACSLLLVVLDERVVGWNLSGSEAKWGGSFLLLLWIL